MLEVIGPAPVSSGVRPLDRIMIMDKLKAAELIQQQRRRWRSQASDLAIARRAERAYFALAMGYVCIAASFIALYQHSSLFPRIVGPMGFFIGAAILYWQSRRFTQIRRLLSATDGKTDSH
jgi:hypothetical protein